MDNEIKLTIRTQPFLLWKQWLILTDPKKLNILIYFVRWLIVNKILKLNTIKPFKDKK